MKPNMIANPTADDIGALRARWAGRRGTADEAEWHVCFRPGEDTASVYTTGPGLLELLDRAGSQVERFREDDAGVRLWVRTEKMRTLGKMWQPVDTESQPLPAGAFGGAR